MQHLWHKDVFKQNTKTDFKLIQTVEPGKANLISILEVSCCVVINIVPIWYDFL